MKGSPSFVKNIDRTMHAENWQYHWHLTHPDRRKIAHGGSLLELFTKRRANQ